MNKGTFGNTREEHYAYFTTVVPYLNVAANTLRFRISASNLAAVNMLYSNPNVPPNTEPDTLGYIELFALRNNPGATNPVVTKLLHERIRQKLATDPLGLENVLREIYADIPASVLTPTDRLTLNLPKRNTAKKHRIATTNTVNFKTVALGGGDVLSTCEPSGTAINNPSAVSQRRRGRRRPRKEIGYEIRTSYIILTQGTPLPTDPNGPGMKQVIDTKAKIVRHLGTEKASNLNITYILCEFKQWHNPKHPELDSPYVGPQTCIIT